MTKTKATTIEKFDAEIWHAWIADTRPDGIGMSKSLRYDKEMRLFTCDSGDIHRTNLITPGMLASDKTFTITKFGIFVSFSNPELYAEFFSSVVFRFLLSDKPVFQFSASNIAGPKGWPKNEDGTPKESFPHGFMCWIELEKPISILPRMDFHGMIISDTSFVQKMRRIETGCEIASFAIIKFFFAGQQSRNIY